MNSTITKIINAIEEINSRITEAEEQINDLEDKMVGIIATEQNIEKRIKINEDSLRDLWDNIEHTQHLHYRGPRRKRERERT